MYVEEKAAKPQERKTVRVAAYARVSADKDASFHSLEAQVSYYEEYVRKHPDWQLVGIYSDNGISGTVVNRPEFQRMLTDCRAGKVDLVITKSITRFARNTVALLETVRELKGLGIDCYFEKENMHSISPDGELLLTLLAMYAEEEARSVSENQKWRIKKKFEKGEPWMGRMLGYRLKNGRLEVVPEEAEIVRRIYSEYLSGKGMRSIAKGLIQQDIFPGSGNRWAISSIKKILTNEKYTGNMILQKTYREDFRTKKKKENHGELKMYRVSHSHEPIIDQATFNAVQEEIQKRQQKYCQPDREPATECRLFRGLIRCGFCGRIYKHGRSSNVKQYSKSVWVCTRYSDFGKQACPAKAIPEDLLIEKTKEVLQVETLDRDLLTERIQQIVVPEHNHLIYYLKNGEEVEVRWQHRSRADSWTPEMRQAARERALKQHRKKKK